MQKSVTEYRKMALSDSSLLTPRQREKLLGKGNPKFSRGMLRRIRKRIEAGMLDMNLLSREWPREEMEKVFPPLFAEEVPPYWDAIEDTEELPFDMPDPGASLPYLVGLIPFLLRLVEANYTGGEVTEGADWIAPELQEFERLIEDGVTQHLAQSHQHDCEVDVSIDVSGCTKLENAD